MAITCCMMTFVTSYQLNKNPQHMFAVPIPKNINIDMKLLNYHRRSKNIPIEQTSYTEYRTIQKFPTCSMLVL